MLLVKKIDDILDHVDIFYYDDYGIHTGASIKKFDHFLPRLYFPNTAFKYDLKYSQKNLLAVTFAFKNLTQYNVSIEITMEDKMQISPRILMENQMKQHGDKIIVERNGFKEYVIKESVHKRNRIFIPILIHPNPQ